MNVPEINSWTFIPRESLSLVYKKTWICSFQGVRLTYGKSQYPPVVETISRILWA